VVYFCVFARTEPRSATHFPSLADPPRPPCVGHLPCPGQSKLCGETPSFQRFSLSSVLSPLAHPACSNHVGNQLGEPLVVSPSEATLTTVKPSGIDTYKIHRGSGERSLCCLPRTRPVYQRISIHPSVPLHLHQPWCNNGPRIAWLGGTYRLGRCLTVECGHRGLLDPVPRCKSCLGPPF
jgi:hypothetical protein